MFELGARWGANLFLAPLVAGVETSELSGPLGLLNALSAQNDAQLHQLLQDVSEQLGLALQNTSSYLRYVSTVKQLAETAATAEMPPAAAAPSSLPTRVPHIEIAHATLSVLLDDYDVWQLDNSPAAIPALLVSFYYDPVKSDVRPSMYAKASLCITNNASGKQYVVSHCCWIDESLNH